MDIVKLQFSHLTPTNKSNSCAGQNRRFHFFMRFLSQAMSYHFGQSTVLSITWHAFVSSLFWIFFFFFLNHHLVLLFLPSTQKHTKNWLCWQILSIINFIRRASKKKAYSAWITITCKIVTWLLNHLSDTSAKRTSDQILHTRTKCKVLKWPNKVCWEEEKETQFWKGVGFFS